jgi:hypothetical protein
MRPGRRRAARSVPGRRFAAASRRGADSLLTIGDGAATLGRDLFSGMSVTLEHSRMMHRARLVGRLFAAAALAFGFSPFLAARVASGDDRVGSVFLVNEITSGVQSMPAVAANPAGRFVVTWTNGTNIAARLYGSNGLPVTGELHVNVTTPGTQNEPAVAVTDDGRFVIAWTDYNSRDGDALGVIAQRFSASGTRVGPEFIASSIVAGSQFQPAVAMDLRGNFVIAWTDSTTSGRPDVYARRFSADGTSLGDQFLVNQVTANNQVNPRIGMAQDGRFVIAWMDRGGADGSGHGVFFRVFSPDGTPLTGDLSAPVFRAGDQKEPFLAVARDGHFVVAWTDWNALDGSGAGVFFRIFDRNGGATSGQIQAADVTAGTQWFSPVGIDDQGRITIAWVETSGRDGSGAGVFTRCFDAGGSAAGRSVAASAGLQGDQAAPSLAAARGGTVMVVFEDRFGIDGDRGGIVAQRFAPAAAVPAAGTAAILALAALLAAAGALLLRRGS